MAGKGFLAAYGELINCKCLRKVKVTIISIHDGHRQRLKKRFLRDGLDSFEEHEALELLLFYAIPRRDTNELAHRLLHKFGSLKHVFDANAADLALVEGIGESAAALIKLQSELSRKYWLNDLAEGTKITSIESAIEYVKHLFRGKLQEEFYVICLDAHFRVRHTERLSRGTATEAPVYIRHITEVVIRTGTEKVMVAHNHPGGSCLASVSDIETTSHIFNAMHALSISFLDHIIIGTDDAFSFSERLLLQDEDNKLTPKEARAAQYSGRVMQDAAKLFSFPPLI